MSQSATVRAQAKLNLWLRVLAREESGYHSIETLFHRIDLADDVSVTLARPGERSIQCSVDVGPPEQNLAFRAAEQYCMLAQWDTGFHIDIVKRIPAGGGFGGGSADAGATLRALNALHSKPEPERMLTTMGSGLGADVVFLTSEAPMALAWGHGDSVLALRPLPVREVALLVPDFAVATADAYRWLDEHRAEAAAIGAGQRYFPRLLRGRQMSTWSAVAAFAGNSFTIPVARHTPEGVTTRMVRALRQAGASFAQMTGSGSTLFGIFDEPPDAAALERDTGCRVILTRTATAVEAVHCSD